MSQVLVAGGSGFIGSHLVESLLNDGNAVTVVDNFCTGTVKNLAGLPDVNIIEANISDEIEVEGKFDQVYHLASPASPIDYAELPLETLRCGSDATRNLLRIAARSGGRFILASTSEIYGDPLEHPQRETYWGNVNSIGPRSCYDEAKRFAEALTVAYAKAEDVSVGIARIFNTYGPRMRPNDGRAVPTFIKQARAGVPISIFGDGSQTRSFCYVDDLVRGLRALADSTFEQPVNLGNPDERFIDDLAKQIIAAVGSKSVLEYKPLPTDDPTNRCPDITRAQQILGWSPRVEFDDGLARTLDAWL
jgi:dTDP-glucose 4,6-dehydratase